MVCENIGNLSDILLKELILKIFDAVHGIGLTVQAAVGDMSTNNVVAMKLLKDNSKDCYFNYQNKEIYTLYDPPHLLKTLFLRYKIRYKKRIWN